MKTDNKRDTTQSLRQYVTARIAGQLFGLPIEAVQEVFTPEGITSVPLAPAAIEGVLNLRGRIVTALNMRRVLGYSQGDSTRPMAIGVEYRGEPYGLIVDEIGEVCTVDTSESEPPPANFDRRWAAIVGSVHRLPAELMVILDVGRTVGGAPTELRA